jgi:hypothetical protein
MRFVLGLVGFGLLSTASFAQSPAPVPTAVPGHVIKLVKLPNGDYTVPMKELQGSGESGNVTLHPQGMSTLVRVYVFGSHRHKHRFNLRSGSDCVNAGATNAVPLKPAVPGEASETLVSVPIENFSSKSYVIDMENATNERQFPEACAKI